MNNPIVNAFLASLYITLVSTLLYYGPQFAQGEDTPLVPIAMLSLFVLSAAVMGFLFLYQPGMLYFDNKKKEAVQLFLKTLLSFGTITLVLFLALFFLR